MHDWVIGNATIVDGTGCPGYRGSVAVDGTTITAIGDDVGPGRRQVDAGGLVLAPGIIDTHTHYDAQITWDPWVSPSPALGVTTVIMGNCGFTVAPCRPADRDRVMRNLTHVEGMSLDALRTGMQWDFQTFPEYMAFLERRGVGVNVAAFVGHSSVRTWAMGEAAGQRAATPDELETMRGVVREALAAGAVGFSTTTSSQHNGEGGQPMPSRFADFAETETLAAELARAGRGVLMMTKDGLHTVPQYEPWAAAARRPFVVAALLHSNVVPNATFDDLEAMRAATSRGLNIRGAISACPLTMEFTLQAPYPFEGLPSWRPAMEAHDDAAFRALISGRGFRDAVVRDLASAGRRLFTGEWHRVSVLRVHDPKNAHLEGKTIADAAREAGRPPLDWMLDLALSEDLRTYFVAGLLNNDEEAVGRMMRDPTALISLSDAGAHLEFLCDAGFALHVFGHWVRDLHVMPLERAVHRMTGEPAALFGLARRGTLAPGNAADMLLFDPATVGRGPAKRVNDMPSGASRLVTPALGVHGVWVNGCRIADTSGPLPAESLPGKLLREFAA